MTFPKGFLWGAATNAPQFEGGRDKEGVGISIADVRSRLVNPPAYSLIDNFKIAVDHYHHLEEDMDLCGELNLGIYYFTISWTRIFPTGREGRPNLAGLAFYDRILKKLEEHGIKAAVSFYAYDMPQALSKKYSGWADRRAIADYLRYVRACVRHFKGRIMFYIPFTEQNRIQNDSGYMTGHQAANLEEQLRMENNLMLAWAACTRVVHEEDPSAKVGGNLAGYVIYPKTCDPNDVKLADRLWQTANNAYGDVFCRRKYSPYFLNRFPKALVKNIILAEDYQEISSAEPDFLSLTYYHSTVASFLPEKSPVPFLNPYTAHSDFHCNIDPYGFQQLLERLWQTYQMPLLVTGNGLCAFDPKEADDSIIDDYRIQYLSKHIDHMGKAMENGVQIIGFMVWSAIDLLSSDGSLAKRSGLVHVDAKTFQRRRKKSFYWYQHLCKTNEMETVPRNLIQGIFK